MKKLFTICLAMLFVTQLNSQNEKGRGFFTHFSEYVDYDVNQNSVMNKKAIAEKN